ncbi:hypothetical protein FACS1894166_12300 [Bacilli bacterium]|nr:hypothetical protein FACS1894166_12300 [Bacilli bacterium]
MKVVRTTMNQMINSPTNQADNYNTARKYLSFFFEMNKVCGKILLKDKTPDGRINVAGPYHQEVAKTFDLMKSFTLYDVQPLVKSLGYLITHKTILPP